MRAVPASAETLRAVYLETLARCSPERLLRAAVREAGLPPRADVVAIGKCAASLLDGIATEIDIPRALAVVPAGYRSRVGARDGRIEIVTGSHPQVDDASIAAGRRLADFVARSTRHIVFLVSGGASACAELPLEPWFDAATIRTVNARLVRSGLPIASMNVVRKHLSAIKGGRLAALARHGATTLVYSDVAAGRLADVGSGPTLADPSTNADAADILLSLGDDLCMRVADVLRSGAVPETVKASAGALPILIADNSTLVTLAADVARSHGLHPTVLESQIESDVERAARDLATRMGTLARGELLCAGGEPTVVVTGDGTGGRCSELAVRFVRQAAGDFSALFGSSDGVDGNTAAAAVVISSDALRTAGLPSAVFDAAVAASDTFSIVRRIGEAIIIPPTGNNLRDLYLLARG